MGLSDGAGADAGRVLITGASGELGGALARGYARSRRSLLLWGRDPDRLDRIARECIALGAAAVAMRSLDLADATAAVAALDEDDAAGTIGLALLVAGCGDIAPAGAAVEPAAQIVRLAAVNYVAPASMAARLGAAMAARGRGAIVLIGSAAGFHALPFAAGYASSKAGLAHFADALRIALARHGVQVTLVSPGFIDTAAGRRNPGPRPFQMSADAVAERVARAVRRRRAHLILPWPFAALRAFDRVLPRPLRDRLLRARTPGGR